MKLPPDQQRIKTLLTDTITLLCKNGLNYDSEFSVDALIGITVDQNQVFLVNIREKIGKDINKQIPKAKKRKASSENDSHLQNGELVASNGGPPREKLTRNGESSKHIQREHVISSPEFKKTRNSGIDGIPKEPRNQGENENVSSQPSFHDDNKISIHCQNSLSQPSPEALSRDTSTNNNYQKPVKHSDTSSVKSEQKEDRLVSADLHVKQEPVGESDETSDFTMQLLYTGQDDREYSNSKMPTLATGPPVWPEPTISFSTGLTLPTVIAPEAPEQSPLNTETIGGQSQIMDSIKTWVRPFDVRNNGSSGLVHAGHRYHKNRHGTEPGKIYYRCKIRKCPGRAILYQGEVTVRGIHSHPPTEQVSDEEQASNQDSINVTL